MCPYASYYKFCDAGDEYNDDGRSNSFIKHTISVPGTVQDALHLVSHVFGCSISHHNSSPARILSEFVRIFVGCL